MCHLMLSNQCFYNALLPGKLNLNLFQLWQKGNEWNYKILLHIKRLGLYNLETYSDIIFI